MPAGTTEGSEQVNYSDQILAIEEKQESYQKSHEDLASVLSLSLFDKSKGKELPSLINIAWIILVLSKYLPEVKLLSAEWDKKLK